MRLRTISPPPGRGPNGEDPTHRSLAGHRHHHGAGASKSGLTRTLNNVKNSRPAPDQMGPERARSSQPPPKGASATGRPPPCRARHRAPQHQACAPTFTRLRCRGCPQGQAAAFARQLPPGLATDTQAAAPAPPPSELTARPGSATAPASQDQCVHHPGAMVSSPRRTTPSEASRS